MKRFAKWFASGPLFRGLLFLGLLIALLIELPPLMRLDRLLFETASRFRATEVSDSVAVVAIDQASIETLGSWPWPRGYLADAIEEISSHQPRGIGLQLLLSEQEWNPALAGIRSLRSELKAAKKSPEAVGELLKLERSIDGDRQLQQAITAAPIVVAPYLFERKENVAARFSEELPPHLVWNNPATGWRQSLANLQNPWRNSCNSVAGQQLVASQKGVVAASSLQGHISLGAEQGGPIRALSLLHRHDDKLFPSLALQLAGVADGRKNPYLKLDHLTLLLNNRSINAGADFSVIVAPGSERKIPQYSFVDVVNGLLPEEGLKDKIVLLGLTTAPLTAGGVVSVNDPPAVIATAAVVDDLITGKQLFRPGWAFVVEAAMLIYLGIFLVFVLPRIKLSLGLLLQALFFSGWLVAVTLLLMLKGIWLMLAPQLLLVIIGFMLIALQRYLFEVGGKFEDLKMLGLSFQSQGMLDMAFDKFRQCPVADKSIKEILYNLALDFERKRMFNKAIAVHNHLLKGGKFKDARQKIAELQQMEQSVVLGGNGNRDSTMVLGVGTNPTLGRYEVVRELGQGAMGTVYLGRDPKINREVAIKTLNLQAIELDQLAEVKERFFREAEAAGRLNHPHIVTIYDAGEELDLAYMAMELLNGEDLAGYCSKKTLLPAVDVMKMALEVAEALAYAHKNGVVHRDIKPSNLMRLEDGKIKVTDFGVARVMNASQTQTGTILGTPSYMSPEQVSGDRVKGNSDLFSLGVVCYEMLSGEKPFVGDSLGALMHNIANVKYTPLKKVAPDLPDCCYTVVRKLLKKDPKERYSDADELASALRKCLEKAG